MSSSGVGPKHAGAEVAAFLPNRLQYALVLSGPGMLLQLLSNDLHSHLHMAPPHHINMHHTVSATQTEPPSASGLVPVVSVDRNTESCLIVTFEGSALLLSSVKSETWQLIKTCKAANKSSS